MEPGCPGYLARRLKPGWPGKEKLIIVFSVQGPVPMKQPSCAEQKVNCRSSAFNNMRSRERLWLHWCALTTSVLHCSTPSVLAFVLGAYHRVPVEDWVIANLDHRGTMAVAPAVARCRIPIVLHLLADPRLSQAAGQNFRTIVRIRLKDWPG